MDMHANTKQNHIIVGCQLLSKWTLCAIKFDKTNKSFIDWLAKEHIFVKSDSLGVAKWHWLGILHGFICSTPSKQSSKTFSCWHLRMCTLTLLWPLNLILHSSHSKPQQKLMATSLCPACPHLYFTTWRLIMDKTRNCQQTLLVLNAPQITHASSKNSFFNFISGKLW